MQVTINVATINIRGEERPLTAKVVEQLKPVSFGGRKDQYAVVCSVQMPRDGRTILIQGPNGLEKIMQSTYVNCGCDVHLGVKLESIPHVILA
jgi:hypothetical protein